METIVLTAIVGAGYLFMKPAEKMASIGHDADYASAQSASARSASGQSAHGQASGWPHHRREDIATHRRAPVLASYEGPAGPPSLSYTDARDEELRQAQHLERAAAYHGDGSGLVDARARILGTERGSGNQNKVRSVLSGVDMPPDDFAHNNMVPFFGSQLHGLDLDRDHGRYVETMSGAPGLGNLRDRAERPPLFAPDERGIGNVFGNQSATDALQARTPVSAIRNNDLPFQQIRVGAGVRSGSAGAGQLDNRDYALPKNVDELRPGNRPKADLETSAHVLPGFDKAGAARPWQGAVHMQRPETVFENQRGTVPNGAPIAGQTVRARYEPRGDVLFHDSAERGFNPGVSKVSAMAPVGAFSAHDRRLAQTAAPMINVAMADRGAGGIDGFLEREGFLHAGTDASGSYGGKESGGGSRLRETGRSLMYSRDAAPGPEYYGGEYREPGRDSERQGDYARASGPTSGNAAFPIARGVVPFSDDVRTTQREYSEMSFTTGPAVPVGPPRLPLYQPQHAPRTTLRETTSEAGEHRRGFLAPAASGLGYPYGGPGSPGGDSTRNTIRQNADASKALENAVRNVRNTAFGGDTSGGVEGAESFTPGTTVREITERNERDVFPTGSTIVTGAGGAGGYAALIDGYSGASPGVSIVSGASVGSDGSPGPEGVGGGGVIGEADGDGRIRATSTHRQFTGQVAMNEGITLRPARPEPTGYGVAHRQAELTSTTAGVRGEGGPAYFSAPRNEYTRPIDYGQIYAATVNSAKESLVKSRERAGHAGAPRGPEVATTGSVSVQAALPDAGRSATPSHVSTGGELDRSRESVALRGDGPQSDRLADANAVLSWTATNPLVPR